MEFIAKVIDPGAVERLKAVGSTPFKRLSYTDAIQILQDVVASKKKKFEFKVRMTTKPNPHGVITTLLIGNQK